MANVQVCLHAHSPCTPGCRTAWEDLHCASLHWSWPGAWLVWPGLVGIGWAAVHCTVLHSDTARTGAEGTTHDGTYRRRDRCVRLRHHACLGFR